MPNPLHTARNDLAPAPGAAIAAHKVVAMLVGSPTVILKGFKPSDLTPTPIWVPAVSLATPAQWGAERRRVKRFLRSVLMLGVVLSVVGLIALGFVAGHVSASSNVAAQPGAASGAVPK